MADYYSIEGWKEFVTTKIVPIRDYAEALLNFWKFLKDLDGKEISHILKEHPKYDVVFLGGVDESGYKENSFAKAIGEILGVRVTDLKAYISFVIQDLEPAVPIKVERTETVKYIELIKETTDLIIKRVGLDIDNRIRDKYINNPGEVLNGLLKFLQSCLDICVGCNKYMTFVWNIRKITRRYLEFAFPEVKYEDKFEFLRNFLGLSEIFIPDVEDEKLRRDYTICGFPEIYSKSDVKDSYVDWINPDEIPYELREENKLLRILKERVRSFGSLLLWLNRLIWNFFSDIRYYRYSFEYLLKIFQDIPNPQRVYLDTCRSMLSQLNWKWEDNVFLYNVKLYDASFSRKHAYYRHKKYIADRDLIKDDKGVAISRLFGFLDQISPALFLGTHEIIFTNKNEFIIIKRM